jgi:hypothetical protein
MKKSLVALEISLAVALIVVSLTVPVNTSVAKLVENNATLIADGSSKFDNAVADMDGSPLPPLPPTNKVLDGSPLPPLPPKNNVLDGSPLPPLPPKNNIAPLGV